MNEGAKMAEDLHRSGVDVSIMPDAVLMDRVADADILIVGADSISPAGLVNKVGTRSAAMRAKEGGTSVISLCSTINFLPGGYMILEREAREKREVYMGEAGISVTNYYYDLTPLSLLYLIVTEDGKKEKEQILRYCSELELHPLIKN